MGCELTKEMINRYYSDKDDIILKSHIAECSECKRIIVVMNLLEKVELPYQPSLSLDERILAYAYKKAVSKISYMKELLLSFTAATVILLFAFIPGTERYNWSSYNPDYMDAKISWIDYELRSFDDDFLGLVERLWDLSYED